MDPNANIAEQRALAALIVANVSNDTIEQDVSNADIVRLAELVLALAEWRQSGGFSPTDPLTLPDAVTLGQILEAAQQGQPVTWLVRYPDTGELVGDGRTISGTMRAIVSDKDGAALMVGRDKDVRDGYVWISATFEHFFPVRDVIKWVKAGEFALNYRA